MGTAANERCGEEPEVFDERVELVRRSKVVGRGDELVGERVDPFLDPPAAVVSQPSAPTTPRVRTPVHDRFELVRGHG